MLSTVRSSLKETFHDSLASHSPTPSAERLVHTLGVNHEYPLHKAVFDGDLHAVRRLLKGVDPPLVQSLDAHGNTPLHLAVIRGKREIVEALLEAGASVGAKNIARWNALDEAIALGNGELVHLLFLQLRKEWKQEKAQKKERLLEVLKELPDFSMKLKWDLGSGMFGVILRQFAPDDTYTITKLGSRLRIDGSLMGLDRGAGGVLPRWRRGAFSLLIDAEPSPAPTFFANHEKARYVDLYKERKERRKNVDREVALLMDHGGEKVKMRTTASDFRPVKTWLQRPATAVVDGWDTQVFEWTGKMAAVSRQKAAVEIPGASTFEAYLAMAMPDDVVAETELDPSSKPEKSRVWFKRAARARGEEAGSLPAGEAKLREITTQCWMAKDFPLTLRQLLPLLEALGEANQHVERAAEFMHHWSDQNLFPVKVQIPLMWTVYLSMRFKQFELLGADHPARNAGYFQVPAGYKEVTVAEIKEARESENLEV
uniref:Ankyrin repeat domain-containing protein n=1 Tax=Auxenochlorella protothecoides TaxID=3075 RepID=A0A1D2AFP4_AUXPR